jgi:hypothetical protein
MSAAQAIGEFLQSPDDLLKVATFRKKLEKEKASIDTRLKSGVKDQLDATCEGLRKLFSTRTHIQSIKDEMQVVDSLCSDPKYSVSTFDQISRVSIRGRIPCLVNTEDSRGRYPWFTATLSGRKSL